MPRRLLIAAAACILACGCSRDGSSVATGDGNKPADTTAAAQKTGEPPSQGAGASASEGQKAAPTPAAAPEPGRPAAQAAAPSRAAETPQSARTGAASPEGAAGSPAAAVPQKPQFREVTVPAGRTISIKLTTAVASDTSKPEDAVRGTLAKPIVVSGATVVPAGAELSGTVIDAKESGRVKGLASVAFRFDRLVVGDESHEIRTARISRQAEANRKDDLKKGGIGAGVGAVVGGIVGGAKGAVIGAGAGGTGAVLATKGSEVRLPAGTVVTTTLQDSLTIAVPLER